MKTRRFLAVTLLASLIIAGCSTAWVTTFDDILTAAAPALIDILNIVAVAEGTPLNATLATKINADAASLKSIASDFASASGVAAPTVCAQLQAAITTYGNDEQQAMALAQVKNSAVQEKVTILSGLVAGTVSALLATVPNCQQAVAMRASLYRSAPPLPLRQFVDAYNTTLVKPTGVAAVDSFTKSHKVHVHGRFMRVVTVGRLD